MTVNYNTILSPNGENIIWYEKDGIHYSFMEDESNPYYQEYLKYLEINDGM